MKIAIIGHKHFPSEEGGIEKGVLNHAVRMVSLGHDVTVYNRSGKFEILEDCDFVNGKEYKGVKIVTIPGGGLGGLGVVLYSFLSTLHAAFCRYDCVSYRASGPCAMIPLAKVLGMRVVASLHGFDSKRDKWNPFIKSYLRFGEKQAALKADVCIVLSNDMKKKIDSIYKCDAVVVPNGIEKVEYQSPDIIKQKYGLEKYSYILWLGRIVPEKNIEKLIEAYRQLSSNKPKLVLAGEMQGKCYKKLKKMAEGDQNIIFYGFAGKKEKAELFSNALLYVSLSKVEGMPNAVLEACAYGCCCLLSDISEHKEITEDKALYCDYTDTKDIKTKLQMLIDNKETAFSYRKDIAENVIKKYNWDDIVKRLLRIYKNG